jgi:hypothetical protein
VKQASLNLTGETPPACLWHLTGLLHIYKK